MNDKQSSKFLTLVLRHHPDQIGIVLDEQGWSDVDTLLLKLEAHGHPLQQSDLARIVAENDKKRFEFSEDGRRIRARQGHSVSVDLQLEPVEPPELLYHGTAVRNLASIAAQGLLKGERHQVHLSADEATARSVGGRYGKPVVLSVRARALYESGAVFYHTENGVWLTDHVPVGFIEFPKDAGLKSDL